MQLIEKIEHEYTVFKLGYLITSKENIFVHAEEIATKKSIYHYLKRNLQKYEDNKLAVARLRILDNMLDNAYGYIQDREPSKVLEQLEMWLQKYCEWQP